MDFFLRSFIHEEILKLGVCFQKWSNIMWSL